MKVNSTSPSDETNTVRIRKSKEEDIAAMFKILDNTLSRFLYINKNCDEYNQLTISREDVREYVFNPIFITVVATQNEEITGWCSGSSDESMIKVHGLENFNKPFYILELVVHPDYQRKGIGKMLLNYLIEIAIKNSNVIVLDTPSDNKSAIDFIKGWICLY